MQTEKEYTTCKEIKALRCESVGEYSLPDYNGDVKRVLLVKTKVFPSGKFASEDSLEFSGSVGYSVVYIDHENKVTHAEFSTDYDAAVKINSSDYIDSDIATAVSSCNLRLIGPRKLSVKSILDSTVSISEKRTYSVGGDAFMEYEPEYTADTAKVMTMGFATSDTREINEEVSYLEGAIADEVEILACDALAEVSVCDKTDSSLTLRGDVRVGVLYRDADDRVLWTEKEIPYSEDVQMPDASDFDSLSARFELGEMKGSVVPTDDGVRLLVSVSLTPRISGKKNCFLNLVCDAFLKEWATVNEYVDFNYTEHILTESCEERFEARESLFDLDIEDITDVLYSDATLRVDSSEICDNSVKICGEIRFSAIACQVLENGEVTYIPVKFSVPFEQNVNINCQIHDNMHINCHAEAKDVKIKYEENHLDATCTIAFSVSVKADKRSRCLGTSYVADEEYSRDESVITVYYPDSSESLFEIAKRFHTSVGSIAEINRLTESVFSLSDQPIGNCGISKLIIK